MARGALFVVLALLAVIGAEMALAGAPEVGTQPNAHIGEVRAIAVGRTNEEAVTQLFHEGWLDANGQLLSSGEFTELYRQIGRTWTADDVPEQYFAIPDLHKGLPSSNELANPFGVLSGSDLVQGGRPQRAWECPGAISYWIFTGHDVSHRPTIHLK